MRLDELRGFTRLILELPRFLRGRIDGRQARRMVGDMTARRAERFLAKLRSAVFDNPASPYGTLCRWAGCEFGDVEKLVATDGVEGALEAMRRAGIYVQWEELKGRSPIVRGSKSLDAPWAAYNNPVSRSYAEARSGGSSGRPATTTVDLANDVEAAPDWAILFDAHGWLDQPLLFWTPGHVGVVSRFLKCSRFGKDMERWFVMARMTTGGDRLRAAIVHGYARWCAGYPPPEPAPLGDAGRVLDYLYRRLDEGARPVMNTSPSAAALLARLAGERGRELTGVSFLLGAEPVTHARFATIEASGARAIATYGTSEGGWIGAQFPGAEEPDEVLIFREAYAVLPNPRLPGDGPSQPLLFTNLRSAAPKVLLNAELGDSGVLQPGRRSPWSEEFGYDLRLHTIRSLRKVTVWGSTFAVSDLDLLLEQVLPRRFGGSHADYQLIEEQDSAGTPILRLIVDPQAGAIDERELRTVFVAGLSRLKSSYGFMAQEVMDMDGLRIERAPPRVSASGKVLSVVTHRAA
ncbi:MAG: hypothetical protein AB7I59_01220 [Geminicoccaceae bacterium]